MQAASSVPWLLPYLCIRELSCQLGTEFFCAATDVCQHKPETRTWYAHDEHCKYAGCPQRDGTFAVCGQKHDLGSHFLNVIYCG